LIPVDIEGEIYLISVQCMMYKYMHIIFCSIFRAQSV
jgi:hypothetical protein